MSNVKGRIKTTKYSRNGQTYVKTVVVDSSGQLVWFVITEQNNKRSTKHPEEK